METMTLKLRGKAADASEIYRSYYLVTDGGRMAGRGRASAIPMSAGAPMPELDYVEVSQGGEEQALKTLVATLCALPGNQGLQIEPRLSIRPAMAPAGNRVSQCQPGLGAGPAGLRAP